MIHGIKLSSKNFVYDWAVIFSPSGTRNGPIATFPINAAQNITPPPPCFRLALDGFVVPFTSEPLHHPSGPSKVALHSFVNRTVWKSTFIYCLAHSTQLVLCLVVKAG